MILFLSRTPRVCLQVCIIRKFHFLARVGFLLFCNIIFKMFFFCFVNSLPQPTAGVARDHQKSVRGTPLTFCVCLPITFYALFISLWIRAQPFPFVYTRTKFDYLKIPNSAASATRAGRPFCFLIIDFFAIIDSWKLITKKIVTSVDTLLNFIKSRCTTLITSFRFLIHLLWLWNVRDFCFPHLFSYFDFIFTLNKA